MNKKYLKFSFKLLVSTLFLLWIIFKVDWYEVASTLGRLTFGSILLYVVFLLIGILISAYKWQILAKHNGTALPLFKMFEVYLTGTFINNFMPSFIGGDTYRTYQVGKANKNYSAAAASVVLDRLTGLISAMLLAILFAIVNFSIIREHSLLIVIFGLICFTLIGLFFLKYIIKFKIWKKLTLHLPEKIKEIGKDFAQYQGSNALWKSIFFGMLYGILGIALLNYILFLTLGIKIGLGNYLTVIFLISIVSSIPVSINNIGIKEWAYVTFFGLFGVSSSAVIAVALVSRILQMLVSFVALPAYLKNGYKKEIL